jgi:hypothetical protein
MTTKRMKKKRDTCITKEDIKEDRAEREGYVRHRTWLGQNPSHKYSKPVSLVKAKKGRK